MNSRRRRCRGRSIRDADGAVQPHHVLALRDEGDGDFTGLSAGDQRVERDPNDVLALCMAPVVPFRDRLDLGLVEVLPAPDGACRGRLGEDDGLGPGCW